MIAIAWLAGISVSVAAVGIWVIIDQEYANRRLKKELAECRQGK